MDKEAERLTDLHLASIDFMAAMDAVTKGRENSMPDLIRLRQHVAKVAEVCSKRLQEIRDDDNFD